MSDPAFTDAATLATSLRRIADTVEQHAAAVPDGDIYATTHIAITARSTMDDETKVRVIDNILTALTGKGGEDSSDGSGKYKHAGGEWPPRDLPGINLYAYTLIEDPSKRARQAEREALEREIAELRAQRDGLVATPPQEQRT